MVHRIDDHRGPQSASRRHFDRAPSGRVSAAFEPMSEKARHNLGQKLARTIEGEVRFDAGSRALYATDASNYRQVPLGVVLPRTIECIAATVGICREFDAAMLMRGGGTSLAGQGCNVAVLIDCSKYLDRILWLDPRHRLAKVEPGCILDHLRKSAETHHLTFGPDPATHDHNTLGGMLGNDSCGPHSIMAGRTSDNVESLEIVTYQGLHMTVGPTSEDEFRAILAAGGPKADIFRKLDSFRNKYGDLIKAKFPKIPRRVSGYSNLDELLPEKGFNVARALVGTESTCVTILTATLNLIPSPPDRVLAVAGFEDIFKAADAVPEVLQYNPIALEAIDDLLIKFDERKHAHEKDIQILPEGNGWLIVEFGGEDKADATGKADRLAQALRSKGHSAQVFAEESKQKKIWEVRESGLGATAYVPGMPDSWPGWEDSAVPREVLGDYLRDLKMLFHKHGYEASVYGHFGDGLVHCRVPFDLRTEAGLANWQRFLDEAADLVVHYGGSLSGEHGDGEARGALLEKMYGPELMAAFREFKAIWDPAGRMNPGKVVDPFPITANLRVGPTYQPPEVDHYFAYKEDNGSFTKATRRCVGVGSCRRHGSEKSVMCPSYMATREEKHSTRGRARLLFEMLHGGVITNGWRSREVEEALNLCLACKGCKSDCPVHVDMATYKAEFRAHYYAGRLRPRPAYSMGLIHRWSRIAGELPWLANFLTQTPGLAAAAKWIGGIAQQRSIPRYERESFVHWFRNRPQRPANGRRVLLWPDTFNNYFRVPTGVAAAEVLESLGYQVVIPDHPVCCGRPLYDWGWLDAAKALWRNTFEVLRPEMEAGTPIIGLEPACVSAFRDELPGLFPGEERADRLTGSTSFLTEFLDREGVDIGRLRTGISALVQFHCHHHAVLDTAAERRVLDRLGLNYEVMASGCCGMAGSFGFEAEKYPVSMAAAERVLLPKLRAAPSGSLILANGFSCREQIEQGSGRPTLHIAELVTRALAPSRR
jgi:FAD/FMN-containing dehydrogenase/Fe-S oxidoreductase